MKVIFQGEEGTVRKERFCCKAGAYDHKTRIGWVVDLDGEIVFGGDLIANNACHGANRHDYPEYKTRNRLLEDLKDHNEWWSRMKARVNK
jgi:hypothetical protein